MTFAQLWEMAGPEYLRAAQRPAFHLLLLAGAGTATHAVDFTGYELAPGRSLWVRPGQVQRFGAPQPGFAGLLVLFEPDFLIPGTRAERIAGDRLAPVALDHDSSTLPAITRARRELCDEYRQARNSGRAGPVETETLRHLLSVLLLRLSGEAAIAARERPSDLYRQFVERLERDFTAAHDVAHYADAVGYSTRTLTRATRATSGQAPKEIIQDRLALEARRLLAHTDLPVSVIATQLGFRDPSNFAAFFIRKVGLSATEFRARQRTALEPQPGAHASIA